MDADIWGCVEGPTVNAVRQNFSPMTSSFYSVFKFERMKNCQCSSCPGGPPFPLLYQQKKREENLIMVSLAISEITRFILVPLQ